MDELDRQLAAFASVRAPAGFAARVNQRLEEEAEWRRRRMNILLDTMAAAGLGLGSLWMSTVAIAHPLALAVFVASAAGWAAWQWRPAVD